MLKYADTAVVLQEVPDEISLAINITGCKHMCIDCHSKYLWEDTGAPLLEDLFNIIGDHPHITCVCFMGGDHEQDELIKACKIVHAHNLKACLYSGYDFWHNIKRDLVENLDYIKLGHFDTRYGPLSTEHTNQRMYMRNGPDKDGEPNWTDITYKFRTKDYLL